MADPNWRKIVDNLLEKNSTLMLEHAAMKALASDLEEERNALREQLGGNETVSAETNGHGHGHGHSNGESVEYRVGAPE